MPIVVILNYYDIVNNDVIMITIMLIIHITAVGNSSGPVQGAASRRYHDYDSTNSNGGISSIGSNNTNINTNSRQQQRSSTPTKAWKF